MTDETKKENKDVGQTPNDKAEYTEYLGLKLKGVSTQLKDEYKVASKFVQSKRESWRKCLKLGPVRF